MPSPNELLIKINADAKNATKAFDDVKAKTEDLQESLNKASLVGAAAFAALTGEVFFAVRSFGEAEQASNQLSQALQNQGIFTTELKQSYVEIADAISRKTGIDDDQIVKAQAVAQSYLGQQKVTKELAQAIVDLSTKTGDLDSAAALVGKSIGTSNNALSRYGVTIREGSTQAEKYKQVIDQLSVSVGGQAEANAKGVGSLKAVGVAFQNVQEGIGKRFAPAVEAAAKALTSFFRYISDSPKVLDFAASLIAGAAAAAAIVAIAGPLVSAITTVSAALVAAGVAGTTLTAVFTVLAGATGIGLLVAAVTFLALNWEKSWLQIRAVTLGAVETLTSAFKGLGNVIQGAMQAFTGGGTEQFKKGLSEIASSGKAGYDKYVAVVKEGEARIAAEKAASEEKQNEDKKKAAKKKEDEQRALDANLSAQRKAQAELELLQLSQASQELIGIKQQELQILKNLETEKDAFVIAAANRRLAQLRDLEEAQRADDLQRTAEFAAEKQALEAELQAQGQNTNNPLLQQQLEALKASKQTELDVGNEYAVKQLQAKIAADNLYLAEQKKFGTAYAAISKAMHSEIYQGTKSAFGELAQLQQSSNSTLKSIGKAAAVANIIIKTAESAMNIYAGFSTIPIVGPALGVAGAAAAIAFGAEQVGRVTAAASGALVGGSGSGDTQPFMLEPGELVSPKRNFNEVVSGVQTERSGIIDEVRERLDAIESGGAGINVIVQGDFVGDENYAQRIGKAISDEIEFRNLRFVGVNA